MNGFEMFAPTLDGLSRINADEISTGSLNGISASVINYISNARFSLQDQIDTIGISGVDVSATLALKANILAPEFTGIPLAPTASAATNSTQIATTAYVKSQAYATISNPSFSGIPAAPTALAATNSTQIATTAYVKNQAYATLAAPAFTGAATFAGTLNTITPAVFAYLSGATSNIQAQLDGLNGFSASIFDSTNLWTGLNTFSGLVRVTNTTATDSADSGALVVSGGVGIGDDLYVAGDISCNTLTATSYVNCNSGIVNATWSCNKLNVDDDIVYQDGRFNGALGGPVLQDIIDAKIAISQTSMGAAIAASQAIVQGQIAILNAAETSAALVDIAQNLRLDTLDVKTRYIKTDYTVSIAGIPLTGGNTYCSSNFRIGDENNAPISLYPSGQISATTFAGDLCNVAYARTDVLNSHSANADMHIGSPSITDVYVNRTITIGDNYPTANCTVKTTHALIAAGRCKAFSFNTSTIDASLWIGDDEGTQVAARSIILGDTFGSCTVNILAALQVGTRVDVPVAAFSNAITVGAGIALIAATGVATAAGVVCNALTINTTLNGMAIGFFTGTTSNIQAQLNLKAPLNAPGFTGIPTAPTAGSATNNTQIATTAYVKSQLYATLASPALSGVPTAPTATAANDTQQIATTAFVQHQANSYISNVTLTGLPMLTIDSSPVLTDNSYRVASTAFVKGQAYAPLDAPALTGAATFAGTLNTITPAVFAFLSGTTSNIQAQLNAIGGSILNATNNWSATNTFAGLVRITNTTATTSSTTGALVVSGGVGIGDDLYVLGDINVQGDLFVYDVLTYTAACATHNNTVAGVYTLTAGTTNITSNLNTNITSNLTTTLTAATTAVVGNLTVSGTTGLAGITRITNTTTSLSAITGALILSGGCGISGNIWVAGLANIAGSTKITNATASTSTATGALTVGGGTGIGQNLTVGGRVTIVGSYNTVAASAIVDGSDYCFMEFVRLNTTYDQSALRINVGNDGFGSNKDSINLNPVGGVGIKTDDPQYELDVVGNGRFTGKLFINSNEATLSTGSGALEVGGGIKLGGNIWAGGVIGTTNTTASTTTATGAVIISGGVGIGGRLNTAGQIAGAGGLIVNGGLVNITSTGALNVTTQNNGDMIFTCGDLFQVAALSTIINADGGHRLSGVAGIFCVGCSEPTYATYGIYATAPEKFFFSSGATADYLSIGDTTITASAGDVRITASNNSVIFGSQIIKNTYTVSTSVDYTFTTMDSVPNVIFVYASAGGVNLYLPGATSAAYNGLHVMIRLISGSQGITLRITGGAARLAARGSNNAAVAFLGIGASENWCAHLLYVDGYWYDTR